MRKLKVRSDSPITYSLDLLGDKWTLLILRDMIFGGKQTFRQLLDGGEKIATNILADRLHTMEVNGLITKHDTLSGRSRFIYQLTEKSIDLLPLIVEIYLWGAKYLPTRYQDELLLQLTENKGRTIRQLSSKLRKQLGQLS